MYCIYSTQSRCRAQIVYTYMYALKMCMHQKGACIKKVYAYQFCGQYTDIHRHTQAYTGIHRHTQAYTGILRQYQGRLRRYPSRFQQYADKLRAIHRQIACKTEFPVYTLASTPPAAAPRPRLPASEPRCRTDII